MLNNEGALLTKENSIKDLNKVSVVLLTQDPVKPMFQHPHEVMMAMPKEISKEIIVVHYNGRKRKGEFVEALETTSRSNQNQNEKILHVKAEGEFASGVMRGVELSNGKYILVMDADLPYSSEIVPALIESLIQNPNFIIVASRFVKDAHVQPVSFVQNAVGKIARLIAKYGLKIRNVKDPMSSCFAFSRHVIKDLRFEGRGKEALLEMLVKVGNNINSEVDVKEIPIKQIDSIISRKFDFKRILEYQRDIWELYKHGKKSKLERQSDTKGRKIQRSVLFLSKAGRFFTVGASGLAVNYVASFLFSSLVPNIWYMYATLFGIILSITSNFILNKIWTFEDRNFTPRHVVKQYVLFLVLCALGAGIQLSLVYVFVESSGIPYAISLILAVCVASISNFLLNKKITFGEKIWE